MIFIYLGHSINNIVQLASHSKVSRTTYYLRKYKQIFYVQLLIKYFIRFFLNFKKRISTPIAYRDIHIITIVCYHGFRRLTE